jgi:hypothetical protein
MLTNLREVVIDGAQAYWLGDVDGNPRGPESDGTLGPLTQALELVRAGTDPSTLAVWARLTDGERYLVAEDDLLVAFAQAATGQPPVTNPVPVDARGKPTASA